MKMKITANERRAEIIRILANRRKETMGTLAAQFDVTIRTIRTDITVLTVDYPLVTIRGNGGCVKFEDWYAPYKPQLSAEEQTVLIQMLDKADKSQQKVLRGMLASLGSPDIRKQFALITGGEQHG